MVKIKELKGFPKKKEILDGEDIECFTANDMNRACNELLETIGNLEVVINENKIFPKCPKYSLLTEDIISNIFFNTNICKKAKITNYELRTILFDIVQELLDKEIEKILNNKNIIKIKGK